MQDSPIQIGTIDLTDFEIPSSVEFGGQQRLAVHKLSDGRRVIERLGPDDSEISFAGTFAGPNAEPRVRAMNGLRLSGQAVWLMWGSFRHLVVLTEFRASFHNPWWIPYKASCVVVAQEGTSASPKAALAATLASDLANATAANGGQYISLTNIQNLLSDPSALVSGTASNSSALAAIGNVVASLDALISGSSDTLTKNSAPAGQLAQLPIYFNTMLLSAQSLATTANIASYVSRMSTNLSGGTAQNG